MNKNKNVNNAKKVKDILVNTSEEGLLSRGLLCQQTRKGEYRNQNKTQNCLIKIFQSSDNPT